MENNFNYGSYGYIATLDFNTAEKFVSVEPRVSVMFLYFFSAVYATSD